MTLNHIIFDLIIDMDNHLHNIQFKSILNFRDIGGISVSGGKKIRKGIIFRSANPDRISSMDIGKFRSLNIRTIIDLRGSGESKKRNGSICQAEILSLPLDFRQVTAERLKPVIRKRNSEDAISDISNSLYLEILDAAAPVFGQVMDIMDSPERCPVLIHCHAGKDRTGIVIALMLVFLGADRQFIINDFMESNIALLPYFRKYVLIRNILSFGLYPYRNMLFAIQVRQRNIESVLDRIENHYGGIEAYLRSAGFDISRLAGIRNSLIEDKA
jgi:protein-tyrosine phosphatase